MRTDSQGIKSEDRLETRIRKDLKKKLRVYCANHEITLRSGVEHAIELLTSNRKFQKDTEVQTIGAGQ